MSTWGKTMTSLGTLFSPLGTSVSLKHMFERCVKSRTKKEEEWLIKDCLEIVKSRLSDASATPSVVIRGLTFVIFANLLGYKSDFASIHAIRLAQLGSLHEKKLGYLSCIFLIKTSDPVSIMVMNTIMRDLGSKNILVVAMAASATCYLLPTNLATMVLPLVAEKLHHPSESKKQLSPACFRNTTTYYSAMSRNSAYLFIHKCKRIVRRSHYYNYIIFNKKLTSQIIHCSQRYITFSI